MNAGKIIVVLLILAAFAAGYFLGPGGDDTFVITDRSAGVSYSGGYAGSSDNSDNEVVAAEDSGVSAARDGQIHTVEDGESIMEAVKRAAPGDTIRVMPGTYHETVYIDKDDIRIIGVIKQGQRATMDGEKKLNDAILYSGNGVVVENMLIKRYRGNAIMGQAGNNFVIRNNIIDDAGVYGIFPQLGRNGIVEHNVISGIEDAAIYVGMSDNVHVAHNAVFDSVAGIEIENSRHVIVENNYVYNNTGGVLAFITPGLPVKTTYDVIIRNNFIVDNNTPNFGASGSTVAGIPAGTGILIMAADDVIIESNIIKNNKTVGILITDHENAPNVTIDPESDPSPDRVMILDNLMTNNGYDTITEIKALMLTELKGGEPDIVRLGTSRESCILNRHRYVTVGVDKWKECEFTNTREIKTYLPDKPVPPIKIPEEEKGKVAYLSICSGCHSYTGRIIGPPVQIIQALYMDNPEGLADYIANPVRKRDDYPEMPPQDYLDQETRLAVAEYMLQVEN